MTFRNMNKVLILLLAFLSSLTPLRVQGSFLVSFGDSWRYLDDGSDQDSTWHDSTFIDTSWAIGNAEFGYGEGDEGTVLGYGPDPNDKYITTYFRKEFNVVDTTLIDELLLRMVRDDGVIVYINGVEVWRNNMPSGSVNYLTEASANIWIFESSILEQAIGAGALVPGNNVIAVEVHQSGPSSTDISFDLEIVPIFKKLIPAGSSWKYLDDGSSQGNTWVTHSFSDASWATGPAELGYGDLDEATSIGWGWNPSNRYITSYFRHSFPVLDTSLFDRLLLRILRDDGAIIYLNGTEVNRTNMPTGAVNFETEALDNIQFSGESEWHEFILPEGLLIPGNNLLAVEVHQSGGSSTDVSFDLELLAMGDPIILRGPYLQKGTPSSVIVNWRTNFKRQSRVCYGTHPDSLIFCVVDTNRTYDHEMLVAGLSPNTKYYYLIGDEGDLVNIGDTHQNFRTSPLPGTRNKLRAWVLGDCGTKTNSQRDVRDAYYTYAAEKHTDMILLLGDNAYPNGTDAQYQDAIFNNMYEHQMQKTVTWSCPGNHDLLSANSADLSGPYYDIFAFPMGGEAGGLPSGTEAYYSFDYGNVHFISMDSDQSDRDPNGDMLTWLRNDLFSTTAEWIVAFWHHPPYTKGSHDSDSNSDSGGRMNDMRENALPILDSAGVDLVLSGHSHSYERSYLMYGHYGKSTTLDPATMILNPGSGREGPDCAYIKQTSGASAGRGAVIITAGSSGKTSGLSDSHPAHYIALNTLGSLSLEVEENRLDLKFVTNSGAVDDYFTILKDVNQRVDTSVNSGDPIVLTASWPGEHVWSTGDTTRSISVSPLSNSTYVVYNPLTCLVDTFNVSVNIVGLIPGKEDQKAYLTVFPNPSSGLFNLQFEGEGLEGMLKFEVFSPLGKVIWKQETQAAQVTSVVTQMDLSKYPGGFYLLKVTGEGFSAVERILLHSN